MYISITGQVLVEAGSEVRQEGLVFGPPRVRVPLPPLPPQPLAPQRPCRWNEYK